MYRKQLLSQAVYDKEDIMNQVSQAPIRLRNGGMLILTLLLALQGLLGIAAIVQTVVSASTSGIDFASLFSDSTFRTGFLTIVIAAVISLVLALAYWLVQRWTFWLIFLAECVALFFGVIAITGNLLDWYIIPVFAVLPALILVYMFGDRRVRTSRKRVTS
jgi:uncharacterized membrane protein (DUF2068 family)